MNTAAWFSTSNDAANTRNDSLLCSGESAPSVAGAVHSLLLHPIVVSLRREKLNVNAKLQIFQDKQLFQNICQ